MKTVLGRSGWGDLKVQLSFLPCWLSGKRCQCPFYVLLSCKILFPCLLEGTNQTKWKLLCLIFSSYVPPKYRSYLANIFHMFRGQLSHRMSQVNLFARPLPTVCLGENLRTALSSKHTVMGWPLAPGLRWLGFALSCSNAQCGSAFLSECAWER